MAPDAPDLVDASSVLGRAGTDARVRRELPPCQIEMATPPRAHLAEVGADLRAARAAVVAWCGGDARPISAAVHPLRSCFDGVPAERTRRGLVDRYGALARRQLVSSLQVHVAPGSCETALGTYNALRSDLPLLAALAAAAPFAAGCDDGMASTRPLVAGSLPRQGTPPALASWEHYAAELAWGARAGALAEPTQWWWELRLHPRHGTVEVRVLDAQPTVADAEALVALVVALVRHHDDRARGGVEVEPDPSWRIDENRWSAMVRGLEGSMADLRTGDVRPTRTAVAALIDRVEPWSERGLDGARALLEDPPTSRLRAVGAEGAVDWLATAFERGASGDRSR